MPLGDGTGPNRMGPRTGRGLGNCFKGGRKRGYLEQGNSLAGILRIFTRYIIPLGGALIAELSRPNSKLKKIAGDVSGKVLEKRKKVYITKNIECKDENSDLSRRRQLDE